MEKKKHERGLLDITPLDKAACTLNFLIDTLHMLYKKRKEEGIDDSSNWELSPAEMRGIISKVSFAYDSVREKIGNRGSFRSYADEWAEKVAVEDVKAFFGLDAGDKKK
jgi:hypothetical protein